MDKHRQSSTDSFAGPDTDSDSEPASNSHIESASDSDDSNHDESDDTEPEQPRQKRRDLRWLHAGLFKDAKGATKDVWYAFEKNKLGRHQIVYASHWTGTSFGNKNSGRWKSDLITWDKHHSDNWSRYITAKGTWEYRRAVVGRAVQRSSLLQTWLDPNSPDLHPYGKQRNRTLAPPLNVIHTTTDGSPGGFAPIARRVPSSQASKSKQAAPDPADCYPGTTIPSSTIKIVVEAYKNCDNDPIKVISNFLTNQTACHPRFKAHRTECNDQIESAFYACGWRIDRAALEKANDEMILGKTQNVFNCKAWDQSPPLRVDKYKGKRLSTLLQQMKDDLGENRAEDADEMPDSKAPDSGSDFGRGDDELDVFLRSEAGPSRPPKVSSQGASNWSDSNFKRVSQTEPEGSTDRQPLPDDEFDFLPDNSMEKGKGVARRKTEILRKLPARAASTPRKRIAENTSDEEDSDIEKVAAVVPKTQFNFALAKRIKRSPPKEHSVRHLLQPQAGADADSDMEIIEEKSTPVPIKAEKTSSVKDEQKPPVAYKLTPVASLPQTNLSRFLSPE